MFILVVVFYSHFVFLSACLSCKPSTLVKDILISADLRTGDRHLIKTVVIKLKGHEWSPRSLRFIRNSQIWYTSYHTIKHYGQPADDTNRKQTTFWCKQKKIEKKLDSHIKFLKLYDAGFKRHFTNDVFSWFKCLSLFD